jgi:hypothetical protein
MVLSYEVRPEIASEVHSALTAALSRGEVLQPLGRVTLMPSGRLLVTAPASVQAGVGHIVDEVAKSAPAPTPTLRFDSWTVTATPGATVNVSADLAEIEPALAVIRKTKGPASFQLLEKLSTVTRAGHTSEVRGARSQLEVQASLRQGEDKQQLVTARLEIATNAVWGQPGTGVSLEAQAEMRPGELLVVGQSALSGAPNAPRTDSQVYYIVRATL